ncbi:MAG: hypothetical protein FJ057_09720 [Cyanobacteria bacterium K_DeepCast_0m_m1_088]|nr:hypothetical protein [Cyanobacteria bacterium K_DeepCast_0m_m1_088]
MPIADSAATELAQLLGSGSAGERLPELVRLGLQAAQVTGRQQASLAPAPAPSPACSTGHRSRAAQPSR